MTAYLSQKISISVDRFDQEVHQQAQGPYDLKDVHRFL